MNLPMVNDPPSKLQEALNCADKLQPLERLESIIRSVISKSDDHPSLVIKIASMVGAEILYGVRERGSELNSVELARQFKTSRTPAREAISILEKEGLVEMPPRRRPRVMVLSWEEIKELYDVRAAIAGIVAAEATSKATDEELEGIRLFIPQIERASANADVEGYYWLNVSFQEYMTKLAHNATLQRILETLVLRSLLLKRLVLSQPGRLATSARGHIYMAEAILKRDRELAAALAKSNVMDGCKIFEQYFRAEKSAPQ